MSARNKLVATLLSCGILSTLLYALADVLSSLRWEEYRLADRAMSELMAVGAPTREFIVPFMTAYNLLVLAFGVGVWMAAGKRRLDRVTGRSSSSMGSSAGWASCSSRCDPIARSRPG